MGYEELVTRVFPLACICIGVLGVILVLGMIGGLFGNQSQMRKRFKATDEAVSDLVVWDAVIDDGIILNKNGSLMASWFYSGEDALSATTTDRETWAARINQAVKSLGTGWMAHIDAVRRPCPEYSPRNASHFPDPVSRAMDEERREEFERHGTMYEGSKVFTVTWFPPTRAERKLAAMMLDDPDKDPEMDVSGSSPANILADFKRQISNLENRLSSVFKMERLRSERNEGENGGIVFDAQLQWLHYCLTGLNQPIALPSTPRGISGLIGGQEMVGGIDLRIGDKFVRVVSLNSELPPESHPGMLNALAYLPCECRWNTRFIFLDKHESLARIENERKKWKQKERGLISVLLNNPNGRVNNDAVKMRLDAEGMQDEVQSDMVSAGYVTINIVLMDEDPERLEKSAIYVAKVAGEYGFPAQIEQLNNLDAFLGTLPGHGVENIRAPIVNTMNFADLIPSTTIWTGQDKCPCEFYPSESPALMYCVTSGRTPFRLNLHVRDLGHTIIFGPTGAGKSVLLAALAAQFRRYEGMTIYAFDKGMSMYTLCKAVGGQHYNIAGDEEYVSDGYGGTKVKANYAFCPLQYLETQSDKAWAAEWIETLATLGGMEVTPENRKAIRAALISLETSTERSLEDLHTQLQDEALRNAIAEYTKTGAMGYMLAADQDELHLDDSGGMAVFEIEELMTMGIKKALPVLQYMFRRIERSLKGQPAVIFLDEAWLMLSHPVFREKIREWLKVFRKANCAVVMATQSLSDATESGIMDVIRESTATKIFLPNPYARNEETAAVYQRMGLNQQQIRIIAEAVPKQQYYYVSEMGNRLFELALGPLQLAFMAVSDKESVAEVKQLVATHGDEWVSEWLKERGVDPRLYWKERKAST